GTPIKRAPDPSVERLHRRPDLTTAFVAPRNELEQRIAGIWEEVLGYAPIGVHDDFFALGGDSFLGLQLAARLQPDLPTNVSLQEVSGDWTVARLAAIIDKPAARHEQSRSKPLAVFQQILGTSPVVLLKPGEAKAPFFCIHPAGGTVMCYRQLAQCMGGSRPFYGIQAPSLYGGEEPPDIEERAALYINARQSVRPRTPSLLGGHSFWGNVAFEVASQLADRGEHVAPV